MHAVPMLGGGPLSAYTVRVEPLEDRRESAEAEAVVERDGNDWHANADARYGASVSRWVAMSIAQHLGATALFRSIRVSSDAADGDLVLSGTIDTFEARRDREAVREGFVGAGQAGIGGALGLTGLAIAASDDVPYAAKTVLSLQLTRVRDQAVLYEGTVTGEVGGDAPIQGDGEAVYRDANASLKRALEALIDDLVLVQVPR